MSKRFFAISLIGVFLLALLVPLLSGKSFASAASLVSATARFRVVVAANLATSADVYVDGAISTESGLKAVKPLDASGYISAPGGSHTITLDQTGTTTAIGTPFTANFAAGTDTSVILLANMTWMTLADVNTAPLPLNATARLVNLSASTNPVSLSVDGVTPPAFTGVAYPSSSASYVSYAVGLHTLAIPGSSARTVSANFQDGHVMSIFVFWNPANNLPRIVAKSDTTFIKATPTVGLGTPTVTPLPTAIGQPSATPQPTLPVGATPVPTIAPTPRGNTNASIRVVDAAPSGPNVDVLVDNAPTKLTNLAFTKASTYIPLAGSAAGTPHTIAIVATGTTTPVLASFTANFVSQVDQTLVYLPGSSSLLAFTDQNVNPLGGGGTSSTVNVRFINLSLDNQAMDLWVDHSAVPTFTNIGAGKASSYLPMDLFPHTLEVHANGAAAALLPAVNQQFLSSRVYTVFVFGSAASTPSTLQVNVKTDAQFLLKVYLPEIQS